MGISSFFALISIAGAAVNSGVAWLDRPIGHYLFAPHPRDDDRLATPVELSKAFKEHIFLVDRTRRGPESPTWKFMTKDFADRVETYQAKVGSSKLARELRRLLATERLPFGISTEELHYYRAHPSGARFQSVAVIQSVLYNRNFLNERDMYLVRDVIEQLRDPRSEFNASWTSARDRAGLKMRIDELLAADGDAEFCPRELAEGGRIPREAFEREGFVVKPRPVRSRK